MDRELHIDTNVKPKEKAVLPPFLGFIFFLGSNIMAAENHRELQLLPTPSSFSSSSKSCFSTCRMRSDAYGTGSLSKSTNQFDGGSALSSSVDLQLSISLQPIRSPQLDCVLLGTSPTHHNYSDPKSELSCIEALKWQTAEQIRLATIEKAYAERIRELTRREMELAQTEFIRARYMWERAKEDIEKAERLRETSTRHIHDSTFMEITCYSCHQRFLKS